MKVLMLRKSFFVFIFVIIISIVSTALITHIITKNSYEHELGLNETPDNIIIDDKDDNDTYQELLVKKYNEKKLIALTFDDGPSKYTEELVDNLKKRNIHATFFILGDNALKRKDVLKFGADSGNEIGIHSYVHKLFTKLKDEEILEQIDKTRAVIKEVTRKRTSGIYVCHMVPLALE